MCGIVGFITKQASPEHSEKLIEQMSGTLSHRGPDYFGYWSDVQSGVFFGHQRLSIVDLSPEGHQPMHSFTGRYVIVFNGEIYNHQEIRETILLQDPEVKFRGSSDTEVLLAAIEVWGIRKALEKFVGMFAFALWDKREKMLYLCRDRIGEKPLYYGWMGDTFLFGSELKALVKHPDFRTEINRKALALYLRYGYIPNPYSIYRNIYKLVPGCLFVLDTQANRQTMETYWSLDSVIVHAKESRLQISEQEAVEELHRLIRQSVKQQMLSADVPVGAFLSGGIDSSTVVAVMQAQSDRPIKTFSVGFYEQEYNEAEHAKAVANHLGTDHTELYVTSQEAMDVIPLLPSMYDEPFSDSSQIPTYLVSKLARKHVTVSLSGDGGDELFGGYTRYTIGKNYWSKISRFNTFMRKGMANVILKVPEEIWNAVFGNKLFPPMPFRRMLQNRMHEAAILIGAENFIEFYQTMISLWKRPADIIIGLDLSVNDLLLLSDKEYINSLNDFEQMMYFDTRYYLPDDILVKVDRASMSVSLESRIPLLDHRIVEFAWNLPITYKIKNGVQKWILRQILYKYVPQQIVERPKMGFGVPIDHWLRGPLREWAEELLDERRLKAEGLFRVHEVRKKWNEHLNNEKNWHFYLWSILMFQAWLDYWKKGSLRG